MSTKDSRRHRDTVALLVVSCAVLATAGCGASSPSAGPGGSIEVQSCGRTVALDAPARSVVVVGAGSVDTLFEMGAGDRITGVVGVHARPAPRFAARLGDLPDIGDALPGREALLARQADLVLAEQGRTLSGQEGTPTIEQLRQAGTASYVVASGCDENPVAAKVTDSFTEIENFGTLLGASDGARDLIGRLQGRLDDVQRRVAGRKPVKVAYLTLIGPDLWAFTSGLDVDIVTRAGGKNLWDDPGKPFTLMSREEITAADPEAILFFPSTPTADPLEYVRRNFPTTAAVKDGRIHVVAPEDSARTGVRPVYQVETIARFLHPEAFEAK
ncbi:ABC transporter substrate-binding protein [Amycolatopsis sp. NPDC089917]|uniref:ABC transporter substrate-binding protein n=1 Tax=Amycolatopsis sp. NPDC089917 TaxID=3155187 RepID=UPI0034385EA9